MAVEAKKSQRHKQLKKSDLDHGKLNGRSVINERKSAYNFSIKSERAKEFPLTDFDVYLTDEFKCSMKHEKSNKNVQKIILAAKRENDKMCFPICADCVSDLLYGLRIVNDKYNFLVLKTDLRIWYRQSFSKGEHCYFCGFSDGGQYEIRLNKLRFFMCEHCRERMIIKLKKLDRLLNENRQNDR